MWIWESPYSRAGDLPPLGKTPGRLAALISWCLWGASFMTFLALVIGMRKETSPFWWLPTGVFVVAGACWVVLLALGIRRQERGLAVALRMLGLVGACGVLAGTAIWIGHAKGMFKEGDPIPVSVTVAGLLSAPTWIAALYFCIRARREELRATDAARCHRRNLARSRRRSTSGSRAANP